MRLIRAVWLVVLLPLALLLACASYLEPTARRLERRISRAADRWPFWWGVGFGVALFMAWSW